MGLTKIRVAFGLALLILTAAWLASAAEARPENFWRWRALLVQFTGVLAIGLMSLGVLLAARPVQVERLLGGLDKFYRLHKWLGIAALVASVAHWLVAVAPGWLVDLGWLELPARRAGRPGGAAGESLMRHLREPASELGEWAFYLLLVLVLLALWRRFPYHLFLKTHRLIAPVFLVLVFHSVVMMPATYWPEPVGLLTGLLMVTGTVAAGASLFRRIGRSRRAAGRICSLRSYHDNAVLDVTIQLETAWPGHEAGQFVFLDFDDPEGAHPFTAASAWRGDGEVVFSIKGLGDYTRHLPQLLRVGQGVTLEGPYGCFDFRGDAARQLWIAGGVGITPFVARMETLAASGAGQPIDLIYSTRSPDAAFIQHVRLLAKQAGVRFRLLETQKEGELTFEDLKAWASDWAEADVWFCGPAAFGASLRKAMTIAGLPARRFHQELFEMR